MRQTELQTSYNKAKAALEDLGRVIERHISFSPPEPSSLPRLDLCELILRENPGLNIYEIMEELRKRGCVFTARNPVNSVRTTLYKSPQFVCNKGRFSLKQATADSSSRTKAKAST